MWDQKWLLSGWKLFWEICKFAPPLQLIRTCTAWYKSCQTGNLTASCCTCNPFLDPEYFTRNPYNSCIVHRNFPFGSWGGDLYTRIRGFSFHLYADFLRHKFPVFFPSQPPDFRNISVLFSNTPEFLREDRKKVIKQSQDSVLKHWLTNLGHFGHFMGELFCWKLSLPLSVLPDNCPDMLYHADPSGQGAWAPTHAQKKWILCFRWIFFRYRYILFFSDHDTYKFRL